MKVIDYKTGNTSFDLVYLYHGLQLQLMIYLDGALRVEQKKYPDKEIIPAGVFYYNKMCIRDSLYHDRQNLKSSNILILSPNGVFSDYISHILPELGEENIKEMSFDLFAYKQLRDTVSDCEDRYDESERRIRFPQKASLAAVSYTHLDVYKRQIINCTKNTCIFCLKVYHI